MKKKEFLFICIITMLVGVILCLSLFRNKDITPMDTVSINELVKQTEQNWSKLSEETFTQVNKDISVIGFTVIDLNGTVIYTTTNQASASYNGQMNEAIANRDLLVDIIVKGEMVGKLIVKYDLTAKTVELRKQLTHTFLAFFLFLGVIIIGYFIYLDRKVFRPFHALKQFAAGISAGNLDTPFRMDKKNVFGVFTESFDLMREALKTARYNENLANKSKKELVASLSHDIKNPVASIRAICETMALSSDDRHITTISQKAEQIDSLMSDMFQATLEDLGELKVKTEEYSSLLLKGIIENADYNHKIHMVSKLPECLILCDPLRLTQIIDNILGNSYKYAGTDILISFELKENYLQINIKDFGKGVQEEELPLLWEKFYRGNNAKGKDGAGLGLYLSKLFIEKMGGQIEGLNEQDGFLIKIELRLAGK